MYGRYTQELGVYAKEEAARLRESGQRRSVSDRSRTLDLLEYDKGRCAKCRSKFRTTGSTLRLITSISVVFKVWELKDGISQD